MGDAVSTMSNACDARRKPRSITPNAPSNQQQHHQSTLHPIPHHPNLDAIYLQHAKGIDGADARPLQPGERKGFGVWGLGFGVWGLGFGVWGLGFGVRG